MKTIIIPTDFSPASVNAMHYGVDMAQSINADVLLLNVYQVPVPIAEVPVVLISIDELKQGAEEQMARLKKQVEHMTMGKIKIQVEARLGNTIDELKEVCNRVQPFAVVMGTRGSSGIERALFGSTALSAVRHLTWPVITIPPGKTFGEGIKKIGLACDFREVVTNTPAELLKNFIREFGAGLHVLNVEYKDNYEIPETEEQTLLLHTLLKDLNPVYDYIQHADIEAGISEFAEKHNFDLIVVIPKKHKLLEGIFKPATTKQFLFRSHIPVMCVHSE